MDISAPSSTSVSGCSSKNGEKSENGMDERHWWEYYPITSPNSYEFVSKMEFETDKTLCQIVNGEDNLIPLWCMSTLGKVKRYDVKRQLVHGDQLIMEAFNLLIRKHNFGEKDWLLLKLFSSKGEKTEFSDDGDITLLARTDIRLFSDEEMNDIFPIKRGLMQMLRVNIKGKVEITGGDKSEPYRGTVHATFDLLKERRGEDYEALKCDPPIPFKFLCKICPWHHEKIKFCIDIVLEWSKLELIHKPIKMEVDDSFLSRLLKANESRDFRKFAIVAEDGTEIQANRMVVSLASPVFEAMLSPEMASMESQEGKLQLTGRTRKAVECLVDFLHGTEILVSTLDCDLALELLQLGHAYQLPQLWGSILKLLLMKKREWFSTDVIIELYYFVTKLDLTANSLKLKKHLLSILTEMPADDLFSSERFKELGSTEAMKLMGAIHNSRMNIFT